MRDVVLLAPLTCTGTAPPVESPPPAETPRADPPPPARAPAPALDSPSRPLGPDSPWVWYHALPAWWSDTTYTGVGTASAVQTGDPPMHITTTLAEDGVVVRREPTWALKISGAAAATAVLVTREDEIYVGQRTAAGAARITALTHRGDQRFDETLPTDSVTALQLGLCDGRVCVYVRGRGGQGEVFALTRSDGALSHRVTVDAVHITGDPTWPPAAKETRQLGTPWPAGTRTYVVLAEGEQAFVERRDGGAVLWRTLLPEVRPFHDDAAVLELGGAPVVVLHSAIASGVAVWGLDAQTGALRWRCDPPGIGPVDHSKYRNRVAVSAHPQGHLIVRGEESSGKYVALVDPHDGRVIANEIWRD